MSSINYRGIPLPESPSLQPNNLSCGQDCIAFARGSDVFHLKLNGESKRMQLTTRCPIHQVRIVDVNRKQFIVIASSIGVQIWTGDGISMIHFLSLSTLLDGDSDESDFMCGISSAGDYIFIGVSNGSCCVLQVQYDFEETVHLRRTLHTAPFPISDTTASRNLLVAANENGDIFCFDTHAFEQFSFFQGLVQSFDYTFICNT